MGRWDIYDIRCGPCDRFMRVLSAVHRRKVRWQRVFVCASVCTRQRVFSHLGLLAASSITFFNFFFYLAIHLF